MQTRAQHNLFVKQSTRANMIFRWSPLFLPLIAVIVFCVSFMLSGCVTVNVNFPEGAVQKAADDYVRELYRAKEKSMAESNTEEITSSTSKSTAGSKSQKPSAGDKSGWAPGSPGIIVPEKDAKQPKNAKPKDTKGDSSWRLPSFVETAHAQADFKTDSEKAKEIKARQASRLSDLLEQFKSGAIGEDGNGLLKLKNADGLKPLFKAKVEKLIKEENADRQELYTEILKSNGLGSDHMGKIQKNFARSFQSLAPSGTWIEGADGNWQRKP